MLEASPVRRVIVFGSYTRGTAAPDSDIVLAIDSGGELDGINFFVYSDKLAGMLLIKSDIV